MEWPEILGMVTTGGMVTFLGYAMYKGLTYKGPPATAEQSKPGMSILEKKVMRCDNTAETPKEDDKKYVRSSEPSKEDNNKYLN